MGLDWMVRNKPRDGRGAEFEQGQAVSAQGGEVDKETWDQISISPYETLGCPRIGVDEVATRHFLDVIVPSHREAAEKRPAGDSYREHWSQPDDVLLDDAWGEYASDLMEYDLSTVTGIVAGPVSFRGKVVGWSDLLPEGLRNDAYRDMEPDEMVEYAYHIERAAMTEAERRLVGDGSYLALLDAETARGWVDATLEAMRERAVAGGFEHNDWSGWLRKGADGKMESFKTTDLEDLAWQLKYVLDAANWLRFWADKGHSLYSWF